MTTRPGSRQESLAPGRSAPYTPNPAAMSSAAAAPSAPVSTTRRLGDTGWLASPVCRADTLRRRRNWYALSWSRCVHIDAPSRVGGYGYRVASAMGLYAWRATHPLAAHRRTSQASFVPRAGEDWPRQ